jgi:hypothetical protein
MAPDVYSLMVESNLDGWAMRLTRCVRLDFIAQPFIFKFDYRLTSKYNSYTGIS